MFDFISSNFLYDFFYSAAIAGVFIIVLIILARERTPMYRSFAMFGLSAGLWLALQFLAQVLYGNQGVALTLLRFATVAAAYMGTFFLLFARFYVGRHPKQFVYILGSSALVVITALGLSPFNIDTAQISGEGIAIDTPGFLYTIIFAYTSIMFIVGLAAILKFALRAKGEKVVRSQSIILFLGVGQALLMNALVGYALSRVLIAQLLVPITCFIMIGMIAYAIIRHKLFDIRIFALRALAYTFIFLVISVLYVTPVILLTSFLGHVRLQPGILALLALMTFILAVLYQPLRGYFNKVTNHLFFRDYYEPQKVLDELGDLLVGTVDVEEFKRGSSNIVSHALKPLFFKYILRAEEDGQYSKLLRALTDSKVNLIVTDELDKERYRTLHEELRRWDVALAIRLQTRHEDLGFMLLGFRKSGAIYNTNDRKLLTLIAGEVGITLQNALRFQEIKRFNTTLQEKIDEATRKLRHTNVRLRMLDQTKDDFISMASHQLRTPLTSVKGYVSMVLDGDAGKITALQRKLLNQSFISSQRMVYLISDLLNVSRLRTGKFVLENEPMNLADVIGDEVSQLAETAKGRNLELTYHKPQQFPMLLMDETKLRQVIMNLIDNAVYYTPAGGHIDVYLKETPQSVEFTVVDDGIGVPRHEQPHLFSKFYRAHNAKRARPDGTGLGLYMAKKVVVAQGGAIVFKSQEGKGSTFGFIFAKKRLQETPSPQDEHEEPEGKTDHK